MRIAFFLQGIPEMLTKSPSARHHRRIHRDKANRKRYPLLPTPDAVLGSICRGRGISPAPSGSAGWTPPTP